MSAEGLRGGKERMSSWAREGRAYEQLGSAAVAVRHCKVERRPACGLRGDAVRS